jgi:hypothetical protein
MVSGYHKVLRMSRFLNYIAKTMGPHSIVTANLKDVPADCWEEVPPLLFEQFTHTELNKMRQQLLAHDAAAGSGDGVGGSGDGGASDSGASEVAAAGSGAAAGGSGDAPVLDSAAESALDDQALATDTTSVHKAESSDEAATSSGSTEVAQGKTDLPKEKTDAPKEKIKVAVSRSHRSKIAKFFANRSEFECIPIGSAGVKTLSVVMGATDAYVHDGGFYEWDSAAPVALAESLGFITEHLDGTELIYNNADVYVPDLYICKPEVHATVRRAIDEYLYYMYGTGKAPAAPVSSESAPQGDKGKPGKTQNKPQDKPEDHVNK